MKLNLGEEIGPYNYVGNLYRHLFEIGFLTFDNINTASFFHKTVKGPFEIRPMVSWRRIILEVIYGT
jgi:hypothetical protein